jgi:hypothetical protein
VLVQKGPTLLILFVQKFAELQKCSNAAHDDKARSLISPLLPHLLRLIPRYDDRELHPLHGSVLHRLCAALVDQEGHWTLVLLRQLLKAGRIDVNAEWPLMRFCTPLTLVAKHEFISPARTFDLMHIGANINRWVSPDAEEPRYDPKQPPSRQVSILSYLAMSLNYKGAHEFFENPLSLQADVTLRDCDRRTALEYYRHFASQDQQEGACTGDVLLAMECGQAKHRIRQWRFIVRGPPLHPRLTSYMLQRERIRAHHRECNALRLLKMINSVQPAADMLRKLQERMDVDARRSVRLYHPNMPMYACSSLFIAVLIQLIVHQHNIHVPAVTFEPLMPHLRRWVGEYDFSISLHGVTPVEMVCASGTVVNKECWQYRLVEAMLRAGCFPNSVSTNSLLRLCEYDLPSAYPHLLLLEAGADLYARDLKNNSSFCHLLVRRQNATVLAQLGAWGVLAKCDHAAVDFHCKTPLQRALQMLQQKLADATAQRVYHILAEFELA